MRELLKCTVLVVLALLTGCAERPRPRPGAPGTIEDLRFEVASDPRNHTARRRLALALVGAKRPGAALVHLDSLARSGKIGSATPAYARLLVARARERVAVGDDAAVDDLERASNLDGAVVIPAELWSEAHFSAAAAHYRSTDAASLARAERALRSGLASSANDYRRSLLDDGHGDLADIRRAARWLVDSGARHAALVTFERYIDRGGRDPMAIASWLQLARWWRGLEGSVEAERLSAAFDSGGAVCLLSREAGSVACEAELTRSVADRERGAALLAHADEQGWTTRTPEAAGMWTILALRGWLEGGSDGWLAVLTRRVDVLAVVDTAGTAGLPVYAAPTLLRAAGRDGSDDALDRAIAEIADMSPPERAVVVVEALVRGRSEVAAQLVETLDIDRAARWAEAVIASPRRLGELLAKARDRSQQQFLAERRLLLPVLAVVMSERPTGAYYRWALSLALAGEHVRSIRDEWRSMGLEWPATSPAAVNPPPPRAAASRDQALTAIAVAYRREPAVADRLAEDHVAGSAFIGTRGPEISELFGRLGDPARAHQWALRVVEAGTHHPGFLLSAGLSAIAMGDADQAGIHVTRAAMWSGDPASTFMRAGRAFADRGRWVDALAMGRRALSQTPRGSRGAVYEFLVETSRRADRLGQALEVATSAVSEASPGGRPSLRAAWKRNSDLDVPGERWVGERDRRVASHDPAVLRRAVTRDPTDVGLALRLAASAGNLRPNDVVQAAVSGSRWNPLDVASRAWLAQVDDSEVAERAVSELELIALAGPPLPAVDAAAVLVDLWAARKDDERARVFETIRRGLSR